MNKEALQSIYAYNMLFNTSSDNVGENVKLNTDLISDFDLQNFDAKRFEYYTTLLKTFDNDRDTLKNVLNKYNSVKSLRVKEKKLIREINDYVNKINNVKTGGGAKNITAKEEERIKNAKERIKSQEEKSKKTDVAADTADTADAADAADAAIDNIDNEIDKLINIAKIENEGKDKKIIIQFIESLESLKSLKNGDLTTLKAIEEYEKKLSEFENDINSYPVSGGGFIRDESRNTFLVNLKTKNKSNTVRPTSEMIETAKKIIETAKKNVEKKRDNIVVDNPKPHSYLKEKLLKIVDEYNKKSVGGAKAEEKYSDDTLKAQYLDRKRYSNLSPIIKDEFRDVNDKNKGKLVRIKSDNKIDQLSNDIETYNALSIQGREANKEDIIKKIKDFENDPHNPLEELEITLDDRIVFIIATFFIRYITILMVQWCIDINIIKSFYEGFIYYAIIYIILFWFVVLFINIDNSYDVKYMNFNGIINSIRSLFYYFYMGTNGISRLLIHTSLILLLIVIPIILNIKKKPEFKDEANDEDDTVTNVKILNYEERKQLSKTLTLFTMFIWLFTSIIATKF